MAKATVFVPITPKAGVRLMLSYEEAEELRDDLADTEESPRLDAIYRAVDNVLNEISEQSSGAYSTTSTFTGMESFVSKSDGEVRLLASSRVLS